MSEATKHDQLFDQAKTWVIENNRPSTSGLQEQFGIGYTRATNLLDALEAAKVVTAKDEKGRRKICDAMKPAMIEHELKIIMLSNLVESDLNMRKSAPDPKADKQLKASLKAFGPLQNFIVHPDADDNFGVAGGGRRRRLLCELAEEGVIDADTYPVPCKVVSREDALAATIAENYHRQDPHPLDEFTAFNRLAKREGMTQKQIADEFGVSTKYVRQRLALANVHPTILESYQKDELNLSAIAAFTVEPDQERQLKVFDDLKAGHNLYAHSIKNALTSTMRAGNWKVRFVTLKTYKQAGGAVAQDLFDSDDQRILDEAKLEQLFEEKIASTVEQLKADGWSWVEVYHRHVAGIHYGQAEFSLPAHLQKEKAALEARFEELDDQCDEESIDLEEQIDNFEIDHASEIQYSAEAKAQSGCAIEIDNGVRILRGLIKQQSEGSTSAQGDSGTGEKKQTSEYSQALTDDLAHHRKQALRVALYDQPDLALMLLLFTVCDNAFHEGYTSPFVCIRREGGYQPVDDSKHEGEIADKRLAEIYDSIDMTWATHASQVDRWNAFVALADNHRAQVVTAAVMEAITMQTRGSNKFQDYFVDLVKVPFHELFRPNKSNYFGRVTIPRLKKDLKDIYGDVPKDAKHLEKKADLVKYLDSRPDATKLWSPEGF